VVDSVTEEELRFIFRSTQTFMYEPQESYLGAYDARLTNGSGNYR